MPITDAPDGTLWVQQISVVVDTPTAPEPATEAPAGGVGEYSGDDTEYQPLVTWTVDDEVLGELHDVEMESENYATTRFQLVIGAATFFNDLELDGPLSLDFKGLKLAAAVVVTLSVKSSDATAIVARGAIVGKELG